MNFYGQWLILIVVIVMVLITVTPTLASQLQPISPGEDDCPDCLTYIEQVNVYLDGPSAICYGGESIVDVAKALSDWKKKIAAIEFRGGLVEGSALDAAGVEALAKLPSKTELMGQVVMLAQSPGTRLAAQIGAPAARIAGCVKTLIEKLEGDGAAAA